MKKPYIIPALDTVEMHEEQPLLAAPGERPHSATKNQYSHK